MPLPNPPLRVAVVRPKLSGPVAVGKLLGTLAGFALGAWWLMLILGTVTPWHLSFWHSLLVIVAARTLVGGNGWLSWTHSYEAKP